MKVTVVDVIEAEMSKITRSTSSNEMREREIAVVLQPACENGRRRRDATSSDGDKSAFLTRLSKRNASLTQNNKEK